MATKSNVGIEYKEGNVEFVNCKWDGQPSHNGVLLLEFYSDTDSLLGLLGGGDVLVLGFSPEETEYLATPSEAKQYDSSEELRMKMDSYVYLWREEEKEWYFSDQGSTYLQLSEYLKRLPEGTGLTEFLV